jgi:hypothetical protein
MDVLIGLAVWVALAVLLLLPPLVQDDVKSLTEQWPTLDWWPRRDQDSPAASDGDAAMAPGGRPIADGGRVCHNCGSYVEDDYLYCADCLMPKV